MKKFVQVCVLTFVLVFGVSGLGFCQSTGSPDVVIENIGVSRILSAEVKPVEEGGAHYLHIITELYNKNEKDIKLTKWEFTFFIQKTEKAEKIGEAICAFDVTAIPPNLNPLVCPGKEERTILLEGKTEAKKVLFVVKIENPEFSTIVKMLNFLGQHEPTQNFFITGRFDLGVKSTKGWTYAEALRVEWMFCPEKRPDLPLITPCPEGTK